MNVTFGQLYEIGKKIADLHLLCIAGYVSERGQCRVKIDLDKFGDIHTGFSSELGMTLSRDAYWAFAAIRRKIKKQIPPTTDQLTTSRIAKRRRANGMTKALRYGIGHVKSVVGEMENSYGAGSDGLDFFHAGLLVRLAEALSGTLPEYLGYKVLIEQLREYLSLTSSPPSDLWILPGESDFFADGRFDFGKINISGIACDAIHSVCANDGRAADLSSVDFPALDSGIMALALDAQEHFPEIIPGRIILKLLIPKKGEWKLKVEHDREDDMLDISKPPTFDPFSIRGEMQIKGLLVSLKEEGSIPRLKAASDADKKRFVQIFNKPVTRYNANNGFESFCRGLGVHTVKELGGALHGFSKWVRNSRVDYAVLHIEEEV